jgi:hypothetical protein
MLLARAARPATVIAVAALAACSSASSSSTAPGRQDRSGAPTVSSPYPHAQRLFSFADSALVESSGVVSASYSDRLLFTHNDSGDSPRFYAVDWRGCTLARFHVRGAQAIDWEDIAHSRVDDGREVLWLGDIGDNQARRAHVTVYEVDEPRVVVDGGTGPCPPIAERTVQATAHVLRYPDGPHDAEALFAEPTGGRLFVVTKGDAPVGPPTVYAAPTPLRSGSVVNEVAKVTELHLGDQLVTGADMSPDATRIVVRGYANAYEWRVPDADITGAFTSAPQRIALPLQPQGEGIGYTRDGRGLLLTSEDPLRTRPPVWLLTG